MGLLTDKELNDNLEALKDANQRGDEDAANNILTYLSVRFKEVFKLKGGRIIRSGCNDEDSFDNEYLPSSQRE